MREITLLKILVSIHLVAAAFTVGVLASALGWWLQIEKLIGR